MNTQTDVIINELSSVFHAICLGWPKCGAQFPRVFLSHTQATIQGYRACARCFRKAGKP